MMKIDFKKINFENKFIGLIAALLFGVTVLDNHDPMISQRLAADPNHPSRASTYTWNDVFKRSTKKNPVSIAPKNISTPNEQSGGQYSIHSVEREFDKLYEEGIDFYNPVLFEYYFIDENPDKLENIVNSLSGKGYNNTIYRLRNGNYELKLEQIAIHNPRTFFEHDEMLFDLAKSNNIKVYDGYEIKKLGRFIKHPTAPDNYVQDFTKRGGNDGFVAFNPNKNNTGLTNASYTSTPLSLRKEPASKTNANADLGRPTTNSRNIGKPNTRGSVTNSRLSDYLGLSTKKEKAPTKDIAAKEVAKKKEVIEKKEDLKEVRKKAVENQALVEKYRSNSFRRQGSPYIVVLNTGLDKFRGKKSFKYIVDITKEYPTVDGLGLPTQDILGQLDGIEGQIEEQLKLQGISFYFIGRTTAKGTRRIYYATNDKYGTKDLMKSISDGLDFQYSIRRDKKWDIYNELRKDVNF